MDNSFHILKTSSSTRLFPSLKKSDFYLKFWKQTFPNFFVLKCPSNRNKCKSVGAKFGEYEACERICHSSNLIFPRICQHKVWFIRLSCWQWTPSVMFHPFSTTYVRFIEYDKNRFKLNIFKYYLSQNLFLITAAQRVWFQV